MFLKLIIVFLLLFSFSNADFVTKKIVKKAEGVGYGSTRKNAINEAISEALGKISGVKISKVTVASISSIKSTNGKEINVKYDNKIDKVIKGKIDSYKILDISENSSNNFVARVEVKKTKISKTYKTPGLSNNRRSIVVVPGKSNLELFEIIDNSKSSKETNANFSQELLNSITQTRKFNVLDRSEGNAFYNEQDIFRSKESRKNEVLKLGNTLGADYILTTSIKDFIIKKIPKNSYIVDSNDLYEAFATVQFKIITTSTRQVKFSNTKVYKICPRGNTKKEIYYKVLKDISKDVSSELIANIYPIIIVDNLENNVVLNQGNMKIGTKYKVYKTGKRIVDIYTKESLGKEKIECGIIEIIEAYPKYTIAKIIKGTALKNNIVKILDNDNIKLYKKIGTESNVEIKKNGGVKLPFD